MALGLMPGARTQGIRWPCQEVHHCATCVMIENVRIFTHLAQILLMKTKWLINDVIAVDSPARAESGIFEVILGIFGQSRPLLWLGSHFVMKESLLEP